MNNQTRVQRDLKVLWHPLRDRSRVVPFVKFPGVDPLLRLEMKSTGEVMGIGKTFAAAWSMVTPSNVHIYDLADHTVKGVDNSNDKAVIFNTITISDGISMGTEGMKYSLVSREVIVDSIET